MTDLAIPLRENVSGGPELVSFGSETFSTWIRRRMPFFIARNQFYYWTREWQAGESEALRDLEEGRFETFADGTSAARWLFSEPGLTAYA